MFLSQSAYVTWDNGMYFGNLLLILWLARGMLRYRMRFFRVTLYVLLVTLVLNLSDWPFVDEIFVEQGYSEKTSHDDVAQTVATSVQKSKNDTDHFSGSIYQSLTNLVDMPFHSMRVPTLADDASYASFSQAFLSATPVRFQRPPVVFLS